MRRLVVMRMVVLVIAVALSACSAADDIQLTGATMASLTSSTCSDDGPRIIVVDLWPADSDTGGAVAVVAKWNVLGGTTSYQGSRWVRTATGASVSGFSVHPYASLGFGSEIAPTPVELDIADGTMVARLPGCEQRYSLSAI